MDINNQEIVGIAGAIVVIAIYVFIIFRDILICRYRRQALDLVYGIALTAIAGGWDWEIHYKNFKSRGSYYKMFFSFHKWRYSDFFPEFVDNQK